MICWTACATRGKTPNEIGQGVNFAVRHHRGQGRKTTGAPAVSHAIEVLARSLAHGADEETAIAAVLHDVPEDCGGRPVLALIHADFGARVARLVDEVTTTVPGGTPFVERRTIELARLKKISSEAILVNAADKTSNARALLLEYALLGPAIWQHFSGTPAEISWSFEAFLEAVCDRAPALLVRELELAVTDLCMLTVDSARGDLGDERCPAMRAPRIDPPSCRR